MKIKIRLIQHKSILNKSQISKEESQEIFTLMQNLKIFYITKSFSKKKKKKSLK